jgi:hypothetical protein
MRRIGFGVGAVLGCGLVVILALHFLSTFGASALGPSSARHPAVQAGTPGQVIDIPENATDFLDWQLVGTNQTLSAATEMKILDALGERGGQFWSPDKVTAIYYGIGYKGATLEDRTYLGTTNFNLSNGEIVPKLQGRPTMIVFYQPTTAAFDWSATIVDVDSQTAIEAIHHNKPN